MSEAPERIGLVSNGLGGFALWNREDNKFDPAIEYIRADLFDAVKAERDALVARVKALTEALDERQDGGRDFWVKWTQKRLETRNAMFLRDAKLALGGDMRALAEVKP